MNRPHTIFLLALILATAGASARAAADDLASRKLVLVATHPALGSIAEQIGGDRVSVTSITPPTSDIHAVEAKPSVFALLSRADAFVHSGLDLEIWVPAAIDGSRNPRIRAGRPGNIDASAGIKLLDVPTRPNRSQGDVHVYGNPHYWMDPLNAKLIANNIAAGLSALDGGSAETYLANSRAFEADINRRLRGWLKKAIPHKNTQIVVYHDSFPYFVRRFGLRVVGTVEPKPRIPPTQGHLRELIDTMKARQVRILVREPFHDPSATDFLAERTGARVVTLSTLPGGLPDSATYQDLIERDLDALIAALR